MSRRDLLLERHTTAGLAVYNAINEYEIVTYKFSIL